MPGTACPGAGCAYAIYNCDYPSGSGTCAGAASIAPVGTATLGAGLWGQLDLTGEIHEWSLDWYASTYTLPCTDCAQLTPALYRANRGGYFSLSVGYLFTGSANGNVANYRLSGIGFRCARTP
jgi:sulfatase modifying factor 1